MPRALPGGDHHLATGHGDILIPVAPRLSFDLHR
jgi:hypothetical protein